MKLPADTIIAPAKLTQYLLIYRPVDDKSKFLARAGYSLENWQRLESDIRSQILPLDVMPNDEVNRFGDVYGICGSLTGPNGLRLRVITIWMIEYATGQTKFITLYPNKEDDCGF